MTGTLSSVTVCLTCPTSVTTICSWSQARIPLKEYIGGIRSRFALSVLFTDWGCSTNNFWLLVFHLAFTNANSVGLLLCTTDYLISLSDADTNSEHLPIADITNRTNSYVGGATKQCHSYSLASARVQVHMCTANKLYLFPFNT